MSIAITLRRDFGSDVTVNVPDNVYEQLADNARHGAAWLDEHRPGWAERVQLDVLDMEQACACVCGQVFRDEAAAAHAADPHSPCNGYDFAKILAGYTNENDASGRKGLRWVIAHGFSADDTIPWVEQARIEAERKQAEADGPSDPPPYREWAKRRAAGWMALDHAWRPLVERRAAAALPVAPA